MQNYDKIFKNYLKNCNLSQYNVITDNIIAKNYIYSNISGNMLSIIGRSKSTIKTLEKLFQKICLV